MSQLQSPDIATSDERDVDRRIYLVASLPRTGHHAFVNNISFSLSTAVHINDACELSHRPGEIHSRGPRFSLYVKGHRLPGGTFYIRGLRFWKTYFAAIKLLTSGRLRLPLIYSFENGVVLGPGHLSKLPAHRHAQIIYFVRDPVNWLASLKKKGAWGVPLETWRARWIYLAEYLTENPDGDSFTIVNYNKWAVSDTYRREIAERLNIPYTTKGVDEVSQFGGGSSFGDQSVESIRVESQRRWREFVDDPEFRELISDPRMLQLAEQIFGDSLPDYGLLRS